MYISSHAVGVVLAEIRNGQLFLTNMEYTKHGRSSIRHIMETGEDGETIMDTLLGSRHEAAMSEDDFDYELVSKKPILISFGSCQKDPRGTHLKVFFLARPKGALRNFPIVDGDETLGRVDLLAEAGEIMKKTEGKTVKIHYDATVAAVVAYATEPTVFKQFENLILKHRPAELSNEQAAAIAAYPGKW